MLRGETQGANRQELLANAREQAEQYFDTRCVKVVLTNERTDVDCAYTYGGEVYAERRFYKANFTATLDHFFVKGVNGQACVKCSFFEAEDK